MMDKPLVSIIMAVYNTESFLREAIDSVLNQTYRNWELICVDDGSTDGSLSILETYKRNDSRIVVISQKNSGTASGARNTAIKQASGDFIAVVDSDDTIEEEYIKKLLARHVITNAELVVATVAFWNYKNSSIDKIIRGVEGQIDAVISGREAFRLSLDWKISALGLCKADLLRGVGGYDTLGMSGDEYTSRLLFLNSSYAAFSDATYYYRKNQSSTTKKFSVKHFDVYRTSFRLYELIKDNKFEESFIEGEREKLIQSLSYQYLVYFQNKRLLNDKEVLLSKSLLNTYRSELYDEIAASSFSKYSKRYKLFLVILSSFKSMLLYSVLKGKLYTILSKIKELSTSSGKVL